jgi:hypothetical protein
VNAPEQICILLTSKAAWTAPLTAEHHPHQMVRAACLFGAPISATIARNSYAAFRDAGVQLPNEILATSWDEFAAILDHGGYVRYDFKTAAI